MSSAAFDELGARLARRAPRRDAPVDVSQAAVALLLAPAGDDLELLLIQRAERVGDPWSGHMALPGGRRDAADRDLLTTALRETREELGVDLLGATLLGELDDLHSLAAPARVFVRPFVFAVPERPSITTSAEVALHVWTSLRELARAKGSAEVQHHGAPRVMPCYRVGAHVVWGMTQRILEPFVALATQDAAR